MIIENIFNKKLKRLLYINVIKNSTPLIVLFLLITTRWVKLNDLNFDIINWSVKDKFIDILH